MDDVSMPSTPKKRWYSLSPLNARRWSNFKRNRRAYWSLWIFMILFGLSLFALSLLLGAGTVRPVS